jgi:hypothetical protein
MTRDVVEHIEVAGDLNTRKRKAAECKTTGKCRPTTARQQSDADNQQRRTEAEYEAPLYLLDQQGGTETSNQSSQSGGKANSESPGSLVFGGTMQSPLRRTRLAGVRFET